jgi:diguanylate cyclase (GGDEF)-like protein
VRKTARVRAEAANPKPAFKPTPDSVEDLIACACAGPQHRYFGIVRRYLADPGDPSDVSVTIDPAQTVMAATRMTRTARRLRGAAYVVRQFFPRRIRLPARPSAPCLDIRMHVDLRTLYLLAIGTLLASAGMMFWEHRTNPKRSRELRMLAAGFVTLALGCVAVLFRHQAPGALGSALSNLVMLSGYLLVLGGVAALSGRRYRAVSALVLIGMALIWAAFGVAGEDYVWSYVSAVPIAAVSALTAWEMLRCDAMKSLPPRRIVVAVTGFHALCYAARAFVLPWLVTAYGPTLQSLASKITIYEGVLYSVLLPMTLLKLIRDEAHSQLLQESQTDYLTRLGNRRWFFEQGARLLDAGRARGPVSVLAFDLDRFKAINDRYGHETGDKVLKSFAAVAQGVVGPDVILARIGGEEFAALLCGDDAPRARTMGETIARRFAAAIPERIDGVRIPATVSIGLARFDNEVPPLAEALAAADQALYRAKSLGGNRLELAQMVARAAAVVRSSG